MGRPTFVEEFDKACRRLGGDFMRTEMHRVHKDAVRDKNDVRAKVDIRGPEPWRHDLWRDRTGLTL